MWTGSPAGSGSVRWKTEMDRSGHHSAGFSLLEVLVAFVILTMTFTVLFKIFSTGTRNIFVSADYSKAVMLAESQLAASGISETLELGEEWGEWGERFRWHRLIKEYQPWDEEKALRTPVSSYLVTVEVHWGPEGEKRHVTLSSVRLKGRNGGGRRG